MTNTEPSSLTDENAFGLLIEYFNLEDEEYASEDTQDFAVRFQRFETVVAKRVEERAPAAGLRLLILGHAVYMEFEEELAEKGLIGWCRELRQSLQDENFESSVVLSHGGRWREAGSAPRTVSVKSGTFSYERVCLPSEPLRRALLATSAAHGLEEDRGWGTGLYVDVDAIEALGLAPKNEPTRLSVAGADFYRLGS